LKDLATLVPGLLLGDNLPSFGAQVSIRGVGTNAFDIGVDQSVSLNIDGLQLTQALAFIRQAEVLKGPQALFYGKSSPGGVISLRTADPTDSFEIIARGGYEFDAQEKRGRLHYLRVRHGQPEDPPGEHLRRAGGLLRQKRLGLEQHRRARSVHAQTVRHKGVSGPQHSALESDEPVRLAAEGQPGLWAQPLQR
jgi:hypothetical protein